MLPSNEAHQLTRRKEVEHKVHDVTYWLACTISNGFATTDDQMHPRAASRCIALGRPTHIVTGARCSAMGFDGVSSPLPLHLLPKSSSPVSTSAIPSACAWRFHATYWHIRALIPEVADRASVVLAFHFVSRKCTRGRRRIRGCAFRPKGDWCRSRYGGRTETKLCSTRRFDISESARESVL